MSKLFKDSCARSHLDGWGWEKFWRADWWCSDEQGESVNAPGWKSESLWRCVRFSSLSVPDDYLKLIPVLRPYFHQITGVVWAASWRRDIRKGIFHDSLSLIYAVGTENVSFQKPVS